MMFTLIENQMASMMELCEYYTLDEALMLYDLMVMRNDIEAMKMEESRKGGK